ncbi:ribosome biogenesis protein NOP53-like [Saccoglossus kowalevskii]|uniref:Ribosome biogenesis protein NOP53 n=1 Tax=Saccoglossus kowalevskii TaxID=10224 RepID=A0ABM0H0Y5_SACKO|nr:PREDICTED: glioma tumor suppressor candidate region gene 2 protein-like [Saccoglossus kowalevskii]
MAQQSNESPLKTRKRAHGSKNRKKSWKKIDVTDVEEQLEDQRLQLRTGGLVAEKADDQLFFVDKKDKKSDVQVKIKSRLRSKPYRCYPHLHLDPKIPPARRVATRKPKDKCKNKIEIEELEKQGIYTKSKKRKLEQIALDRQRNDEERKKKITDIAAIATYDLWGGKDPLVAVEVNKKTQVEANEHYLKVTKKTRKKIPADYHRKRSSLPAVDVIQPGGSYNPSYDDHQKLLRAALDQELELIEKSKKDERKSRGFTKVLPQEVHNDWLVEMSAGLFDEGDEEEEVEEEDHNDEAKDTEVLPPNAPVRADQKKTPKQRRKEKERKLQEKLLVAKRKEKSKMQDVYRLRRLKAEIAQKEKVTEKKKETRLIKRNDSTKVKKLGRHKYIPPKLNYQVSEELTGNLRLLKPEGSIIHDRYKSLQSRNILEPRVPVKKKRRYKLKVYEKRSYRDFK